MNGNKAMKLCTLLWIYVMLLSSTSDAGGSCRSAIPNSFTPSVLTPNASNGSNIIHIFEGYNITCSGRVTTVDLLFSFSDTSSQEWNDTLAVTLLFLEVNNTITEHEVSPISGYTLKDTVPLSISRSEMTTGNDSRDTDSFHILTRHLRRNVTIAPPHSRVGFELPPSNNIGDQTRRNYIPLVNLMSLECNSSVSITNLPNAKLFCYKGNLPPIILTVEADHTGEEATPTSPTEETFSASGSEAAVIFMGFIIAILLTVVAALVTVLVRRARKLKQSPKKRQGINTPATAESDPSRCNAVYSHIADREAVYEELPFTAGLDLVNGQAKVHSSDSGPMHMLGEIPQEMDKRARVRQAPAYHIIEGNARARRCSTASSHHTNSCISSQAENAYHVLHADAVENIINQYQELPEREWSCNGGIHQLSDAQQVSYPVHPYHVVDRRIEESQYHTLEYDAEITADLGAQNPRRDRELGSDEEHVCRTLETVGGTTECDTCPSCPGSSTDADTGCGSMFSSGRVLSSIRRSACSVDDENAQQGHWSAAAENPYHVLEVEETTDYQALGEEREGDHVYQTLGQVTDYGTADSTSQTTA